MELFSFEQPSCSRTASEKQKRVLRYVKKGRVLKLKSYLGKHPDVQLNFWRGRKQRTPLHLACCLGNDAALRLLLRGGADAARGDRRGNTPLHVAARMALKHAERAYDDLVIPLLKYCPAAMDMPNHAGVTPRDMLQCMNGSKQFHDPPPEGSRQTKLDPEIEWREKLFGEYQDELFEAFGHYDDDSMGDGVDSEDFGQWADRMWREYHDKQRAKAQGRAELQEGRVRKKRKKAEDSESGRELQARLEREHAEYVERAARKAEETLQEKKRRYEESCTAALGNDVEQQLGYADIPWPSPRGSVAEMVAVILHGTDRGDRPSFRRLLRRQQALWHPDKFVQRCGGRLRESDRQRILDTVTALSQELNSLAQSVR